MPNSSARRHSLHLLLMVRLLQRRGWRVDATPTALQDDAARVHELVLQLAGLLLLDRALDARISSANSIML